MRLLSTFKSRKIAKNFSFSLNQKKIDHLIEEVQDTDWGSDHYGLPLSHIWIYDEERLVEAQQVLEQFNPDAEIAEEKEWIPSPPPPQKKIKKERIASFSITSCIMGLCIFFFVLSRLTEPRFVSYPTILPPAALVTSPIEKALLFDYPKKFELANKIFTLYDFEKTVPKEAYLLIQKMEKTSYWHGFYAIFVSKIDKNIPIPPPAPLFEKISQGEYWRLFTPALLHGDILHILFNMAWLFMIGKQMEKRMSFFRFLLFIVVSGVFSNTLQYLMSGANFIGFSGILCAMIAFVWTRKKNAPWEGYLLEKSTFYTVCLFIGAMLTLEIGALALNIAFNYSLSPGIANTAHLSGAFIGYLFAKLPWFSRKVV